MSIEIIEDIYAIEEAFANADSVTRQKKLLARDSHRLFTQRDDSKQTGRPHHLTCWLSGLLTGLGAHRRGPTKNR